MKESAGAASVPFDALVHLEHRCDKRMVGHHEEEEVKGAGVRLRSVLVCLRGNARLPENLR